MHDESKCPVSGKRKYATEGEALATAAHQIATANAPKDLRAYLCSWCDAWHLTKNAGKSSTSRSVPIRLQLVGATTTAAIPVSVRLRPWTPALRIPSPPCENPLIPKAFPCRRRRP